MDYLSPGRRPTKREFATLCRAVGAGERQTVGRRTYVVKQRTVLLLLSVATLVACGFEPPEAVVRRFYTARLAGELGGAGIPTGRELQRMKPYLSDRLYKLIVDAEAYQQGEWARSHQTEPSRPGQPALLYKPPFVDGDYFSSMFEGPRSFRIASTTPVAKGTWRVAVAFGYGSRFHWTDSIVVKRQRFRYVIDDVIYSGAGEFNPPGSLSRSLSWREGSGPAAGAAPN